MKKLAASWESSESLTVEACFFQHCAPECEQQLHHTLASVVLPSREPHAGVVRNTHQGLKSMTEVVEEA